MSITTREGFSGVPGERHHILVARQRGNAAARVDHPEVVLVDVERVGLRRLVVDDPPLGGPEHRRGVRHVGVDTMSLINNAGGPELGP
jgi:hypothetical protein